MSNRQAALDPLKALPKKRLAKKLLHTAAGGLVALGGIRLVWAGVEHEPDPTLWLVMTGLAVVVGGGHVMSQELTRTALAFVVGAVRDLMGVFAKRNGTPPSA